MTNSDQCQVSFCVWPFLGRNSSSNDNKMGFLTGFFSYILDLWHEFVSHVTHEEKKGKTGFWHAISTYLVAIPVGLVMTWLAVVSIFVALMMAVPIGHLFGYNLADKFAKWQVPFLRKWMPASWIPAVAKYHSAKQTWTSINPSGDVFKEVVSAIRKQEERGRKKAPEYNNEDQMEIIEMNNRDQTISVNCWNKFKRLDVMDLKVMTDEQEQGGCIIKARSASAGLAPLLLPPPFGLLASVATFWVPYPDYEQNEHRLDRLRGMLPTVQRRHEVTNGHVSSPGKTDHKKEL